MCLQTTPPLHFTYICVGGEVREASSLKFIKIGQNPGLQPLPTPPPPHPTWSCQTVAPDWKKLPHLMYFLLLLFLLYYYSSSTLVLLLLFFLLPSTTHHPLFTSSSSSSYFLLLLIIHSCPPPLPRFSSSFVPSLHGFLLLLNLPTSSLPPSFSPCSYSFFFTLLLVALRCSSLLSFLLSFFLSSPLLFIIRLLIPLAPSSCSSYFLLLLSLPSFHLLFLLRVISLPSSPFSPL